MTPRSLRLGALLVFLASCGSRDTMLGAMIDAGHGDAGIDAGLTCQPSAFAAQPDAPCTAALLNEMICPAGRNTGTGFQCLAAGCWSEFQDGPCGPSQTYPDGGESCLGADSCTSPGSQRCQNGIRTTCQRNCWTPINTCDETFDAGNVVTPDSGTPDAGFTCRPSTQLHQPASACTPALFAQMICPAGRNTGTGFECTAQNCWSEFQDGPCGFQQNHPDGGGACFGGDTCNVIGATRCQDGIGSRCDHNCWTPINTCTESPDAGVWYLANFDAGACTFVPSVPQSLIDASPRGDLVLESALILLTDAGVVVDDATWSRGHHDWTIMQSVDAGFVFQQAWTNAVLLSFDGATVASTYRGWDCLNYVYRGEPTRFFGQFALVEFQPILNVPTVVPEYRALPGVTDVGPNAIGSAGWCKFDGCIEQHLDGGTWEWIWYREVSPTTEQCNREWSHFISLADGGSTFEMTTDASVPSAWFQNAPGCVQRLRVDAGT